MTARRPWTCRPSTRPAAAAGPEGPAAASRRSSTTARERRSARCSPRRSAGSLIGYLGSLFFLLLAAFWDTDSFTAEIVHTFTLDNFRQILEQPVYREVAWRTIKMAALVTVADAVLAFPIAYYMARVATPRTRNLLVVAVLVPLWASYLVKAYAWRTILSDNGVINWLLEPLGLQFNGYSTVGLWLVFTYLWLPFMILPIYAGLERIPGSLLEASADLGGARCATFFRVTLPLVFPAVVAGLDLHVLAHARRLHRARSDHQPAVHRHGHLRPARREPPGRRRVHLRARSS